MNSRSPFSNQGETEHQGRSFRETRETSEMTSNSTFRLQTARQSTVCQAESQVTCKQPELSLSQADQDILLRQQALMEAQRGNYGDAIAIFNDLILRNPNNATDYNNRGLVYFQSGRQEAAIADYNRALEINPLLDSVYNNRANYYAAQGDFLEAIMDYDMALDLNPSNIRAWINQGITFRDLQMYEQAMECFDLALCMGQLEGHIYAERGRTYHVWGDWNCAIADYKRALANLPMSISVKDPSTRLRIQISAWLDELLSPWQ